ncbi:MAG: tRNA uridine(34) 5-carboxymethylaminomethyl modification radical SAM/GNAT enzyme Elp3 [Dehalococcoidia bacterium]|nr:MAG: tRNA uridine(34) 5-carboxymethylaminomethyl modification radical SAM/GNAT enzyme Elp3 [Dehalococcoidia bacterium]
MKKLSRTISGVTPVAVMTQPNSCPGQCIYCPTFAAIPRSYTPESPAVLRAISCNYDAKKQIKLRLRILAEMEHPTDKVELIIMGGTFLACAVEYQYKFIKDCFDGLNGIDSTNLEEAQKINEKARNRCVGLCIETRPDWCRQEDIKRMIEFGVTRIELGVQTLDDDIYKIVGRGHLVEDVVIATRLLKEYGFKVHYHWMPGLPGSSPQHDLELSKMIFSDTRFRPDGLKIYPTMVVEGTKLEKWHREGKYQPYDDSVMVNLVTEIKANVPKYVRISRVLRDIPAKFIVGGLKDSLRDVVRLKLKEKGINCRCIRCREYGHRIKNGWQVGEPNMERLDYEASGGQEILLSLEDKMETLFGLLRLRIQDKPIPEIDCSNGKLALVRELHVYGPEVNLGKSHINAIQHKGIGKHLLTQAERIAFKEFGVTAIVILSGVGARQYYRFENMGYQSEMSYMVKRQFGEMPDSILPGSNSA